MPNQSKSTFPSDTQKNPKDCMAIELRSGKDLSNNKRIEGKKRLRQKKKRLKWKERRAPRLNSRKEVMTRKRRKEYQLIHLQCHFHRDFRSQEEKNSFLNSWTFSRK